MKHKSIYGYIFVVFFFLSWNVQASWFIDQERFHISVHGKTSCMDCHQEVADRVVHPDPDDVNKNLTDFFAGDLCADCHDSVDVYVAAGSHGGRDVTEPADIENCLECHDPHYESDPVTKGTKYTASLPIDKQCDACHDKQEQLPAFDTEDETCMTCHRMGSLDQPDQPSAQEKLAAFCLHCHDKRNTALADVLPLVDPGKVEKGPHQSLSCLVCHLSSAQFGHAGHPTASCLNCHSFHDEAVAHDAHITVSCEACHLGGGTPVRDGKTKHILWQKNRVEFPSDDVHQMKTDDDARCSRCHYSGNVIGAAAMVLPAKSLICMPCHTATFTIGDNVTLVSLAIFLLGISSLGFVLLSGSMGTDTHQYRGQKIAGVLKKVFSVVCSKNILGVGRSLIFDALLQRRLMAQSVNRWIIHGLIFYPFVIRFAWGISALLLSLWFPDCPATRIMMDKNHPATALLFDITGIMVLIGVGLAVMFRKERVSAKFKDMPRHDWLASLLLGGIIAIGFVLEAMRITITGSPEGAVYSFLGYGISRLFTGMTRLNDFYGYVWYTHAVFTGLFVAYLPFSRMLHMIVSPVVMALGRIERERK